ncbi:C-GCAxxG-C-C family protein [Sinanaerobacter sp. ZZT-01]|uniref:C-GCAxxG-C-C family protein n=1 Tax=Sinanaerobacter sp. ZZT-01 TaxID=3111540 RepID=UPI002D79D888|nr:C-GCAxxG-C-C family protein [Sinanaerobacter sp. ZZT-01]WRR92852.1 C-GCAxxG-C-C family protein [Sinanaerobacter sp. ZZT-01]
MEDRKKKAVELHHKGYNCTQAVVCSYCDLFGMDEAEAFRISEGFGGGMGGMHDGTCGAVTGAYMLAGLKKSSGDVQKAVTKKDTYRMVREISAAFKEKNTSTICADLLGAKGQPKLRSCDGCIEDACEIAEKIVLENLLED